MLILFYFMENMRNKKVRKDVMFEYRFIKQIHVVSLIKTGHKQILHIRFFKYFYFILFYIYRPES